MHWEHQCKKHLIFYLFNTDTVTDMNLGTDMDPETGMTTSTASETTTNTAINTGTTTDIDMVTNTETHIDTDMDTDMDMATENVHCTCGYADRLRQLHVQIYGHRHRMWLEQQRKQDKATDKNTISNTDTDMTLSSDTARFIQPLTWARLRKRTQHNEQNDFWQLAMAQTWQLDMDTTMLKIWNFNNFNKFKKAVILLKILKIGNFNFQKSV